MQYRVREQKELKPSGVEWLGDIPKNLCLKKLKYFSKIKNGKDQKGVLDDNGIYPIFGSGGMFGMGNKYLHNKPSVLLGRKGTINKPIYIEKPFWTVDTMYYTNIFKIANPKFFFYGCLGIPFGLYQYGSAIPSMTQEDLNNIYFSFPSLQEQQKIANFLDEKSNTFDDAILKKEELISKLQDAKQSLISEVVTGKLKVTNTKENNWKTKKLGYIFKFKNGVNADSSSYGKGLKFINVKETINTDFILEKDIEGSVSVSESIIKENLLEKGDVLFNRTSETAEEIALSTVYYDDAKALFGGFVIRGRQITNDLDLDFKRYCFQSYEIRKQIISFASGSIRKNIAQTNLKDVYITFPNIEEQKQISKYLDEKVKNFDNTIEKTKQSIIKLKQAKEALISEAVTGKIEIL